MPSPLTKVWFSRAWFGIPNHSGQTEQIKVLEYMRFYGRINLLEGVVKVISLTHKDFETKLKSPDGERGH